MKEKRYIAIDLKSFYASVECADRGSDTMTTNLVVADPSRTEKTICLAVSPSLKECGIPGRPRLFEVVQRVKEVNRQRLREAVRLGVAGRDENGRHCLSAPSYDSKELAADPSLELAYITAPPRMALYEKVSTQVYSIYKRYISPDDIHVYSIDECFIDATPYLSSYGLTSRELAMAMIRDVLKETRITATAGIGTNLYLAKIAMDIMAKHVPADSDGVRIAELDEMSYRRMLWCHRPITDFWRVGKGTADRISKLGCHTMGDVALLSTQDEARLYKTLGINAELLIDHAWGWEPVGIPDIKAYRPETSSISSGQVLMEPYDAEKGKLIVREMAELLALDLVRKGLVTKQLVLTLGYDRESLKVLHPGKSFSDTVYSIASTEKRYMGEVSRDHYGRITPKHAHGTANLEHYTSSARKMVRAMTDLYDRITDPDLLIRRVTVVAAGVIKESDVPPEAPEQMDLFTDYGAREAAEEAERSADEKEKRMQKATLLLQDKYGRNVILKGMNLQDGATTMLRNRQIGGHRAE